jgi:hypothetical protein
MDLKTEFLRALRDGESYDNLLELVHRYQAQGITPREVYQVLHQLWLEFGFNRGGEGNDLQDNLEAVMERVWYGCPAK